jgi:hypothetical protein
MSAMIAINILSANRNGFFEARRIIAKTTCVSVIKEMIIASISLRDAYFKLVIK